MKKTVLISLVTFLVNLGLFAQDVKFTATAPKTVVQGTRFQVVYSINKEASDLRVPNIADFQTLMGPTTSTSSQVNIINNQVSRSVNYSFTYILRGDKTGTFVIPPATIEVDGKRMESNSLTIEVIQSDGSNQQQQQQSNQGAADNAALTDDDLFISMTASKLEAFQDEPILITTKIYTLVNLEGVSDIKNPELRNFIVEDLDTQSGIQWAIQNINGKNYKTGVFSQKVVYPQASGKLYIEPTSIEFLLRQRSARQSQSIFDDFFDSYRTVKRRVSSKGITINVKPLPTPVPPSFSGIVGDVNMNISVSKTEAKVNDGITVKALISGNGNIRLAKNPEIKYPVDFDVFDPKTTNNITQTAQGGRGSRTIETLIIPRHAGSFEIAAVEYSYFNPATGRYQTLRSNPITIHVEKSGPEDTMSSTTSPGIAATRENIKFLGQDIRFIKTSAIQLKPKNTFLFGSPLFALGLILPLLVFVIVFFLFQKRIKENANLTMVRTRKANKMAHKRLKKSAYHLKKGEKEAFYEELSRALWGYVSDKLAIPQSELNRDNSRTILFECGASDQTTADFLDILDTCEYARYAPQSDHQERDFLYKKAVETISKLESQLKKQGKGV